MQPGTSGNGLAFYCPEIYGLDTLDYHRTELGREVTAALCSTCLPDWGASQDRTEWLMDVAAHCNNSFFDWEHDTRSHHDCDLMAECLKAFEFELPLHHRRAHLVQRIRLQLGPVGGPASSLSPTPTHYSPR